jgi:hypothetical protein
MQNQTTDKATARPWHFYWDENFGKHKQGAAIDGQDRKAIFTTEVWDTASGEHIETREVAKSNCALIVRAVNEYDALCAVAEAAKECLDWNEGRCVSGPVAFERMEQAIATLASIRKGAQ